MVVWLQLLLDMFRVFFRHVSITLNTKNNRWVNSPYWCTISYKYNNRSNS